VAWNGKPVAKLVAVEPPRSLLGLGIGDPTYLGAALTDEEAYAPMSPEELKILVWR
jgi:hypothetical protein